MLTQTFLHVPGIGEKTERKLWCNGILHWDDFLASPAARGLLGRKYDQVKFYLELSRRNINNILFFKKLLLSCHQWRLFKEFQHQAAYLDIETNGYAPGRGKITLIGLYADRQLKGFINGENLALFRQEINNYSLIITFNGSYFDLPFIEHDFGFKFWQVHIDLRLLLQQLGFHGGLKKVEKMFGLARDGEIDGLNGYDAVLLWRRYRAGDKKALKRLIDYNAADTKNLEFLMTKCYQLLRQRLLLEECSKKLKRG